MSEYVELKNRFKNFSFNDIPAKRNKDNYLICFEVYSVAPCNYDLNICSKYKGV